MYRTACGRILARKNGGRANTFTVWGKREFNPSILTGHINNNDAGLVVHLFLDIMHELKL